MKPEEYERQQKDFLRECIRVIKPSGSIFYNHIDILNKHQTIHPKWVYDFPLKQVILWNRRNTPKLDASYFLPISEYIFWIQKTPNSKVKFNRNKCLFKTNIWNISPAKNNDFPAPFPVELPYNCILATTDENDIILDPYMGSGTTGVACRLLNRKFVGIELNKDFYNQAKNRINHKCVNNIVNDNPKNLLF